MPHFALLGVLYGMGAAATAAKLGMEVAAAGRITQAFFDHFKQIKAWIQQIKRYWVLILCVVVLVIITSMIVLSNGTDTMILLVY